MYIQYIYSYVCHPEIPMGSNDLLKLINGNEMNEHTHTLGSCNNMYTLKWDYVNNRNLRFLLVVDLMEPFLNHPS